MKKACFCGKVTMEFPEKPLLHFMCHCTDCDSLWNGAYMGFVYPTYIPAGFLKNEVDFSPQVEIFAYNKYKCFGDPETLVESFDDNGTVERISAVIEAMNQT